MVVMVVSVVRANPVWRWMTVAIATLSALAILAPPAYSHPLHTTLTEVTVAPDGSLQIVLRAFVNDFSAAIAGSKGAMPTPVATPTDSATARYVARTVALVEASGRRVPLAITGIRRAGELVWVTLRARTLRNASGARLTNSVLFDRYDDQVNIVQTSVAGRRQTLLFTKREGVVAKTI
jgi:hypothetical protein